MYIARVAHGDGISFGIVEGAPDGDPGTLVIAEVDGDPFGGVRPSGRRWSLNDVRLLAPTVPTKVVCVGRNYAAHAHEQGHDVPTEPLLFQKPLRSVIGPYDSILLPARAGRVEHEAELAVVIGAPGADRVDRAGAARAIFGYTCANDVTARDVELKEIARFQWLNARVKRASSAPHADIPIAKAKAFDSFAPLGPWIATGVDTSDLEVRCEVLVAGSPPGSEPEVRQAGCTKDMTFDPSALVSYVSQVVPLVPGDIVLTGTPEGVGRLGAGDVVSIRIDGIGTLVNEVVDSTVRVRGGWDGIPVGQSGT